MVIFRLSCRVLAGAKKRKKHHPSHLILINDNTYPDNEWDFLHFRPQTRAWYYYVVQYKWAQGNTIMLSRPYSPLVYRTFTHVSDVKKKMHFRNPSQTIYAPLYVRWRVYRFTLFGKSPRDFYYYVNVIIIVIIVIFRTHDIAIVMLQYLTRVRRPKIHCWQTLHNF